VTCDHDESDDDHNLRCGLVGGVQHAVFQSLLLATEEQQGWVMRVTLVIMMLSSSSTSCEHACWATT